MAAKSIHEIMKSRKLEVVDGGEQIQVKLPEWFPAEFTKEAYVKLEKQGITAEGILCKAVQQMIIDLRSVVRAENQKEKGKPQEAVNKYVPTIPGLPSEKRAEMAIRALSAMSLDEVASALAQAGYSEEQVQKLKK